MKWNLIITLALLAVLAMYFAGICLAADGEGSALLVPAADWVAGSFVKFEVDYTAGSSGIAVGGQVVVTFHHALEDLDFAIQATDPSKPGYVKVLSDTPDNLSVTYANWATPAILKVDGIYHHAIIAKVLHEAIKPGEKLRFILGAGEQGVHLPIMTDKRNQIHVLTDADGDGALALVKQTPVNNILAKPVHHLFVTASATPTVGESARVLVRAEDEYNNLVENYVAQLRVSGMPGCPKSDITLKNGLAHLEIPIAKPGVFRISATAGGMTARSNPIVAAAKAPQYRVYFGDIHNHTQLSDGLAETAEECYAYARDMSGLDVCATSEHAPREPARLATKKFNEPGRFVTIWGYEWTSSKPGRLDRNLYFNSEDDPIPQGWPPTTEGLWESIEKLYGDNKDHRIIVGPHMFTYKTKSPPWYEDWNANYERFVEIYSTHGMSEYLGNPRMLAGGNVQENFFTQDGLKYGRRFGIIASSDGHDSHPGRSNFGPQRGGLVAFLAKDLTRESIWDAWWNRRVYATTTERIYIDFKIDGHEMGEEYATKGKPKISYTVYGCDDNFDVFLLKNCEVMKKSSTSNGEVKVDLRDEDFQGDSYYYLRVVQKDVEWAWSSPIWVDKSP
ncbi:MAG: DUF3604 domain-containing protein [Armatimonadetes bacterium]|nr:DUF3604 domain-containing protein [Armatimonadota bacterium]